MSDYLSLEKFAERNQKNMNIYENPEEEEGELGEVRIRAVDASWLVEVFDKHGIETPDPDSDDEVEFTPKENVELMHEVLKAGLVEPEVETDADLMDIGRYKQQIFLEIIEFSGLAEAAAAEDGDGEAATFQEGGE